MICAAMAGKHITGIRALYLFLALSVVAIGVAQCGTARGEALLDTPDPEWRLVWADEFNGTSLDRTKWTPETSCWGGGNYERQCYTDRLDNIEVKDGILHLKAKAESFTGLEFPQDRADRGRSVTRDYTSGKLRTTGLQSWTYGRFEARLKLPKGQGTWPAFWMLPENNVYGEWPLSGEIDIMEAVNLGAKCDDCGNSKTENRSSVALHFGDKWPDNKFKFAAHRLPDGIDAYHIFAVEWAKGKISWFVNDTEVFTLTQDDWYSASVGKGDDPAAPFNQAFYLNLNLAVGGRLAEQRNEKTLDPSSFPNALLVDWVRVYECVGDELTSRGCLTAD